MSADAPVRTKSVGQRLASVPRPVPLLTRDEAAALTSRQREILDDLTRLMADGFSHLTMADIAGRLGCSLRTLYGIAPSRDLLVLLACDRYLWGTGRAARDAVGPSDGLQPLEGIRRYLRAATLAVNATTAAFSADLADLPGGAEIRDAHTEYLVAITRELLDMAAEQGDIAPVDSLVVAHAMAGISTIFIQPDVIDTLPGTPKQACDTIVDLILQGLTHPRPSSESS